jgi:5-methylthioadenosine/S-adenosylhomocysteine deaminase
LRAVFVPQILLDPLGVGETIETAEAFVAEWKDRSPLILPGFGPHAPYSVSREGYQRIAALAEAYDVPVHTHLSETDWETHVIHERYGCTPTEMLLESGVLNPRLSVAHGVRLTDRDVSLLLEHGVGLVHNPSSNMKLASGVARITDYLSSGLQIALGTDSNLSNNDLDLFEEMRLAAFLQKLAGSDATALPVQTVLDMATRNGAQLLGLQDQIGSLEVGKQADVILLDLKQPHLWPLIEGRYENIVEQIVYAAHCSDVTDTIVAGKLLMADRELLTLDVEEAYYSVQDATALLMRRAGLQ